MKIFISYAHVDEHPVRALVDILRDADHDPWFDHRLKVGRKWEDQILEAIEGCDRFLYALTPESVRSKWCRWEFAQAVHAGKPVVPVLMQANTPLDGILGRVQYADFSDGPTPRAVAKLLAGVRAAQVIPPAEVPLLPVPHSDPERPVERVVVATPTPSLAAQMFQDAYARYRDGQLEAAQALLQDCLQLAPDHAEAQKLLDMIARKLAVARITAILPPPFEWIDIPAGRVELEDGHGWFDVAAFAIAKYPVTNAQFQVFVAAEDGYRNPGWWNFSAEARVWRAEYSTPWDTDFEGDDLPRTQVYWYEAVAFCRWLSARSGEAVRLPTEQEWQRAAQGDDGREYPWGNEFDAGRCNTKESGIGQPTPVTAYPGGASPYGVMDMSGNVWEWCANDYHDPRRTDVASDAEQRVLRGGAFNFSQGYARCAFRRWYGPSGWGDDFGFRVVCARPPSQ